MSHVWLQELLAWFAVNSVPMCPLRRYEQIMMGAVGMEDGM